MPFSILHFSDLHLDASFAASRLPPEIGRRCREEQRRALKQILRLARDRRADAVTIAGDLFENAYVRPETLEFIAGELASLAPIPVFIAPGVHDAAEVDSPYHRHSWPPNVYIFHTQSLSERALSPEYELWSAAHGPGNQGPGIAEGITAASAGRIPILLLHEQLAATDTAAVTPAQGISVAAIAQAGFGIALLGKSHRRMMATHASCLAVCPGSPQPLDFEANPDHGVAFIALTPGRDPIVEWTTIQGMTFHTLDIRVQPDDDMASMAAAITTALEDARFRDSLVCVRLYGEPTRPVDGKLSALATQLRHHALYVGMDNRLSRPTDYEQLSQEPTVRGAFVREMLAQISAAAADDKILHDALDYGAQAFEQEAIALR